MNQGWVTVDELRVNQVVTDHNEAPLRVLSVVRSAGLHNTYNFEVADFHTYFIGKQTIWVHNTCTKFIKDPGSAATRKNVAEKAKWRGNQLEKHAWDRHPGLAKEGTNSLPNSQLYDQRARQNILDADIVVNRKKGDTLYINSENGLATSVQKGADGEIFINSFHLRTSAQVPNELK